MSACRAYARADVGQGAGRHLRLLKRPARLPPAEEYWHGSKAARDFWLSKRSLFAVLRDRSIEVGDLDTAKLCLVALRATDPHHRPEERRAPLSRADQDAVAKCIGLAQYVRSKGQYVRVARRLRP